MSKRARIIIGLLLAVVMAAGTGIVISLRGLEPRLHSWITTKLSRSFESSVELGRVHLNWFPLQLRAENLTIRHHGRTDIPPLILVGSFSVDLKPTELWSSRVDHVKVDGLEINIPPKDPETGKRPVPHPEFGHDDDSGGIFVKRLTATNARLSVIPRKAGKNPKVWDIFELDVKNLGGGEPASFSGALINPIPYGQIDVKGQFGPWQSDEPGDSPLSGKYTFAADLNTIDGLAGKLDAAGNMQGTLDAIATAGETKTPDFRLTELDGGSLPLTTHYDALVDGTEGDVRLNRVEIQLGQSAMVARGTVIGTHGVKGKRVVLNLTSKAANLGELLRLVSKKKPPVEGTLAIDTAFDLPQGKGAVLQRVQLEGSVRADRVTFTNDGVQDKIDELSRRAQGKPNDDSIDDVASRVMTTFSLRQGVFTYRALSFNVQGATVKLDGTHSLKSKAIHLEGVALLTAPVSKTVTGFKSWLLKPFDPLFRKNGAGTRLVITVEGTQDQPKVKLDFGRTIRGS